MRLAGVNVGEPMPFLTAGSTHAFRLRNTVCSILAKLFDMSDFPCEDVWFLTITTYTPVVGLWIYGKAKLNHGVPVRTQSKHGDRPACTPAVNCFDTPCQEIDLPLPQLYIFPISHYCEKARWALDYLNVDYELQCVAPGAHADVVTKLGAKGTSLPVLLSDGCAIQGSDEIVEWAENYSRNGRSLKPVDLPAAIEIESRLNDVLGVHVRRMYYSEALVEHPQTV